MGSLRMTRTLLPALEASGDGHVVMVGSIAGYEPYVGGGGYNAAKFAVRAMTKVLRQELLGRPIGVTEIAPGLVKTEFSLVRLRGDERGAEAIYEGITPLTAEDVAECIAFSVTRPSHVNIDTLVVLARDQSGAVTVHRH
jgi:NADP-dependent 3-hydroxy acid dehydrogenase YdfG